MLTGPLYVHIWAIVRSWRAWRSGRARAGAWAARAFYDLYRGFVVRYRGVIDNLYNTRPAPTLIHFSIRSKTRRHFAAVELTITESTTPPMS